MSDCPPGCRANFNIFYGQMIFDTSAIEQSDRFALFLKCWRMKATGTPAGFRQSVTSLMYKLYTDILF